ncbi:MAG: hypothetical protein HY512_00795 [Candidatus Aenigmarchaeota archaeon]|nr:hypothetical protein [Candidatus Aenigmarchaeota archaeon]
MSIFTQGNRDLPTQKNSLSKSVFVRLDSKGRISIPSFLRKNFNLQEGAEVRLVFDLRKNFFIVQSSTTDSIGACGAFDLSSTLSSGPQKLKGRSVYVRG